MTTQADGDAALPENDLDDDDDSRQEPIICYERPGSAADEKIDNGNCCQFIVEAVRTWG